MSFRFNFFARYEPEGKAVDAVPGILFGKAFPLKDVTEVALAVVANDLYPAPIGIPNLFDGTGHLIVKTRPAAARAELILTIVQGRVAAAADEDAVDFKVIILVSKRHLGSFMDDDALFLGREGVVIFGRFHTLITTRGGFLFLNHSGLRLILFHLAFALGSRTMYFSP